MKIIVAGGTGFLGKKIVSSLADKGHNVCVLTRNLHKHKNTFTNNVNVIDWSTINPSFLSDTNILIKLNGEKVDQLWTKSVKNKILNSRIDSTKMLFDFCVKNEIIPQKFINASAVGIYAKESANYNFSVDENSELGNTFLAKVCVENERNSDIFKVFEDIDIIQLRIGVVLQKKIINFLSLNLLLSLPVPGNRNHYFPWVHADDIVGFAFDADNKKIYFHKNGTYQNSANPNTSSNGYTVTGNAPFFLGFATYQQTDQCEANFGGYHVYSISSGNSDANGYGNFEYSVPSGYYALNSKNLAEYG